MCWCQARCLSSPLRDDGLHGRAQRFANPFTCFLRAPHDARLAVNYAHYRECTLGQALQDTLAAMVAKGRLTEQQSDVALQECAPRGGGWRARILTLWGARFDAAINTRLAQLQDSTPWMAIDGEVATYSSVADTWHWTLRNVTIALGASEKALSKAPVAQVDALQVVATDAFPGRIISRGRNKKKAKAPATKKAKKNATEDE